MVSNPVSRADVIQRFRDWVTYVVNSGITWGTNNVPHANFDVNRFGGTTAGMDDNLTVPASFPSDPSAAAEVVSALETAAYNFTRIRLVRAVLVVDGDLGYVASDQTAVGHLNNTYRGSLNIIRNRPASTALKHGANMEDYLSSLRDSYNSIRNSSVYFEDHICHSSCHSSCHGSRGRR